MSAIVWVLALAAGLRLLAWLAVHQVTVAALHRAARRAAIDTSPGDVVRPIRLDALGSNPGVEGRFLSYAVAPGQVGILHGRAHPGVTYLSVVLYDRLLQSLPGRSWIADPALDDAGRFTLILAHEDPGVPGWLDISEAAEGVLWERHAGPVPATSSRLEVRDA